MIDALPRRIRRRAAVGLLLGEVALVSILLASGLNLAPLATLALVVLCLVVLIRSVVRDADRSVIALIASAALLVRLAAAVALMTWSYATGGDGFVVGDDRVYAHFSWRLAEWLQGAADPAFAPPTWGGEDYLLGLYVYIETFVFWLFGYQPIIPLILNAGWSTGAIVLLFDIVRGIFGRKAAIVASIVVAAYPSLVVWSSLNLKDALALMIIMAVVWVLMRFQQRPRLLVLLAAFLLLIPMEGLRKYVYMLLAGTIVTAVALVPGFRLQQRVGWTAGALLLVVLMFANTAALAPWLRPEVLLSAENTRRAMTIGARTAYVPTTPLPVRAGEGQTFVVSGSSSATPATHVVRPGTRVVVLTGLETPSTGRPGELVVYVRPGDIVVVGGPDTTPGPASERQVLAVPTGAGEGVTISTQADIVLSTLAHAPTGLFYALFAPFPWDIRRTLDLATVPEMLAWYGILAAAVASVWRERARWQRFGPPAAFVLAGLAVFALVEGNVGTLYRHRGMITPFVIALASPSLVAVIERVRLRR